MSYIGIVSKGVVMLPPEAALPDGTQVRVEPLANSDQRRPLVEKLKAIARSLPDLPPDWAAQHDHYIHGTPRK
jgi:hypothetical protein